MRVSLPPIDHPPLAPPSEPRRFVPSKSAAWLLLGALLGGVVVWLWVHPQPSDQVQVDVVRGTTVWTQGPYGQPVTSIAIRATSGHVLTTEEGLTVAHGQQYFVDVDSANGRGCLRSHTAGQEVVMGVVHAAPSNASEWGVGHDMVVWVECLTSPTRHF